MSNLRNLRTFLAIAHHGSFSEAAEQVSLTQAAVSFQMRALEQELGRPLFERSGRMSVLSPAGRELLPEIQRLVEHYDRLRMRHAEPGELAGSVAFGAIVSCMGILSRAVSRLKRDHPALDVRVFAGKAAELSSRVLSGELDAAIVVESARPAKGLRFTAMYQEPLVAVAAASCAARSAREALSGRAFLRFDRSERTGRLIDQALRRLKWPVEEFLELNSIETLVELVRQEVGVTLLPRLHHASWENDSELSVLPLGHEHVNMARVIGMVERTENSRRDITETLYASCARHSRQRTAA